ncbi:MAG: hypothetical protein Q4G16_02490, partial [Cruoricaptor ignavus]|nr:hypothetical protein [Cruoricaptor ignavus]
DSKTFTYEYNSGTKQLKVVSDDKTEISTVSQLTNSRLAIVDNLNNQNLGEVNPELEGFYFTGTITTVLKK